MDTRGPKEVAFDEKIRPLLDQVKDLCEQHKINFATYFALDEIMTLTVLQARQAIVNDQGDLPGMQTTLKVWEAIRSGEDSFDETLTDEPSSGEGN